MFPIHMLCYAKCQAQCSNFMAIKKGIILPSFEQNYQHKVYLHTESHNLYRLRSRTTSPTTSPPQKGQGVQVLPRFPCGLQPVLNRDAVPPFDPLCSRNHKRCRTYRTKLATGIFDTLRFGEQSEYGVRVASQVFRVVWIEEER